MPEYGRYNNGTNARRISEIEVMDTSSMVWIGITETCSLDQVELIRRNGGTIFTSDDIHELGASEVGKRAGDLAIKGCDYIYISFDIDVYRRRFLKWHGNHHNGCDDSHRASEGAGRAVQVSDRIYGPSGELPGP